MHNVNDNAARACVQHAHMHHCSSCDVWLVRRGSTSCIVAHGHRRARTTFTHTSSVPNPRATTHATVQRRVTLGCTGVGMSCSACGQARSAHTHNRHTNASMHLCVLCLDRQTASWVCHPSSRNSNMAHTSSTNGSPATWASRDDRPWQSRSHHPYIGLIRRRSWKSNRLRCALMQDGPCVYRRAHHQPTSVHPQVCEHMITYSFGRMRGTCPPHASHARTVQGLLPSAEGAHYMSVDHHSWSSSPSAKAGSPSPPVARER